MGPYCSGATIPALPTTSTNGITGTWAPSINNTTTTLYTFTPTAGQCATTATLTITVNPNVTPTFAAVGPYCSGATIPALPTTSTNGITGTWAPAINNTTTTLYTFTPTAGQCATTATLTITVNPNVTPTFAAVGPYCSGATIPALPTTSTNGITGTWAPSINNTTTTLYTFTPTAGQCATTATLTITVNPNVTPTFAAVGPYCSGATIPALPTTSTNGITGTWAPAINNTTTTLYTFTPTAGQCATTATLTITVNANVTPAFAAVGPYCSGATIPALPTTSTNGITGTWAPSINNTTTTLYTFTPTAGQCATTATLTITVNPNVTPTFAAVGPYCSGATIPALPTTSTNGITGTWAPSINNTTTTLYTFTPTAGQCATTTTLTITVNTSPAQPTISADGPIIFCTGGSVTLTSSAGSSYLWSTGVTTQSINVTATGNYTVQVTNASGCLSAASSPTVVTVNTLPSQPVITAGGPLTFCDGGSVTLTASAGTSYLWSNGATSQIINVTTSGSYTVQVTNAAGCQSVASAASTVNVNAGPTAIATTIVNATCGTSNGSVTLGAVTGGVPPYTYSFDGSAFTSTTSYSSLSAGTYAVEVMDINGCILSTTASISNTGGPTAIITTVTNTTCGSSNGAVTLGAVTGGVAPYTYSVDGSAFTSTTSYPGFVAGTYGVEVRDANGCIFSTSATITNTSGPTAIVTNITSATCGASNGSITLGAVTGGVAPFTYSVDGSAFTSTTSYPGFAAGTYAVEVRDANGCTFSTTASVSNSSGPSAIATTVVNATCGASNGSITLGAVTGGVAPFTYSVDGSAFTSTTSYPGFAAGTYAVEVRDANGCTFSTTASVSNTSGPTAIATTIVNATCGASNGSITLGVVTGGVAPFTYSVDGSAFTSTTTYPGFAAGTYAVEVRDANSCTFSTNASVSNTSGPTAIATTIVNATCGASNGSITLGAVTGGVAPYTYSVDGSAFTATTSYPGFAAGTYAVDVRDANSCTFSTTASVSSTTGPTAIATTVVNATCGTSNGSITLGAVTGGVAPYTYSVDGSVFTSTTSYPGFAAGTYAVEVRDANGCTFSTTASVSNTSGPTAIATTIVNAACGASNGSITLGAVTGGVAPYTYSVDGSAFTSTTTYPGFTAGTYVVEVRDANSCTFSTTASVSSTTGPTAIATTVVNATCGASNGSITLGAVTGGVAPYTYSVDGSGFTSTTSYPGFAAGTYTVEVRDANSCTFSTNASVSNTSGPTEIATTIVNATCGASNGSITLGAVTGGVAPYTYSVDGSVFTSTTSYPGFAAGTYAVEVRDANSCTFSTTASVSSTTGPTAIATTVVNATCGTSNGSITLGAVTGGVAPYTYSVDGSGFTSTTSYPGFAAGTYTVEVRDANSCTFSTNASVSNTSGPTEIATTIVNATCGASNGSITLGAVTGGVAPYTYSVDGSAFTATTSYPGFAAGTYTVDVRDANSCTFSTTASVSSTTGPTAIATTVVNATCGTSNGSITLGAVTGGVAPYTYSVDGSAFTSTTSYPGFAAGTYTVEVRDANSCTFSTTASVSNTSGPTAIATTIVNASCGASNGSITLGAVTGGVAPYTYSVDGSTFTSTTSYPGFAAGTYAVEVRDANGCTFSTTASVSSTTGPTAIATTVVNATCGASNGSITLGAVSGGVAPYTYSVDGSGFTSTTTYPGFAAGTYAVEVRDANSCTFSTTASVSNTSGPTAIVTTVVNASCGASNGSITLGAVTGGVAPYTYSVDGSAFTSTTTYPGFAAGAYAVEVRDANSCTFSTTASVSNTSGPTAIATTVVNAACGASNGSITLGAVTGGVAPYTYSVDGSAFTSTTSYPGFAAGTYAVEVRDSNGCTFSTTASVSSTTGPTAIVTTIVNAACGASNGSITLGAVTGGVAPFTYSVDGSAFTSTTTYPGFAAGAYAVEVRDANSCTFSTTASVSNTSGPTAIATTIVNASCGASNGSITLGAVTGGVAPYTYSVDGSTFTSTTSYPGFAAGTYTVEVRDANGCTFSTNASVSNTSGPTEIATTIVNAACGASNGSITLGAVTGGVAPYTYSVDGSAFTSTTSYPGFAAGTYAVEVRDANGCTFSTNASVSSTSGPTAIATTVVNAACGASNGSITLGAVTGGVAPYTYSVDGSTFTSTTTYPGFAAGAYAVEVRDANSCTFSTTASVSNTSGPTAIATTIVNASCGASNGSITLGAVTGGVAPYTYSVDGSTFTSTTSYPGFAAGTYAVEVRDANGCTFSTTASVSSTSWPDGNCYNSSQCSMRSFQRIYNSWSCNRRSCTIYILSGWKCIHINNHLPRLCSRDICGRGQGCKQLYILYNCFCK